ncbi:MAG: AAA family ATPase, partial [Magnetococcales bacterium]|nr:AAA family ATPase [Magnetococcales bacterium]
HKDINPANIVWNPKSGIIKIIDFGLSTTLSQEAPEAHKANLLAGTLAYMAPEQTGRMNRSVDYRADFYSLGATFYHLLTGQPPFSSQDPLELVHSHIARMPQTIAARLPEVPQILSDIIEKCMAKDAELRYQSAYGLQSDLITTQQHLNDGKTDHFPLALNDLSNYFQIPQKLYGRDKEMQALEDAVQSVGADGTKLFLIAGHTGVGKTALVNEMRRKIAIHHGLLSVGKYDQLHLDKPNTAFTQVLRGLLSGLLLEKDEQLEEWRQKIRNALGDSGRIIADEVPELELLLGTLSEVPEVEPREAITRFHFLFCSLLQVFASPKHPLVVFLDDLQWADLSSLSLLEYLFTGDGVSYCLIIGTYRDNEVANDHPLLASIAKIQTASHTPQQLLTLSPPATESMAQLVADTVHSTLQKSNDLALICQKKTHGNPFFLRQFLHRLFREELLYFRQKRWNWDLQTIQSKNITDNVVNLMAELIGQLPQKTQIVLQQAACIGAKFDLETLSILHQSNQREVARILWPALESKIIIPLEQEYELAQHMESGHFSYRFIHDRTQQAAYGSIDPEKQQTVHLTIGRLLRDNTSAEILPERIYDIVSHLNLGMDLMEGMQERLGLAELNLQAGKKAVKSAALELAHHYFSTAMSLSENIDWKQHYFLKMETLIGYTGNSLFRKNFEEVKQLIEIGLQHANTPLDRSRLLILRMRYFTVNVESSKAVENARQALLELGEKLPSSTSPMTIVMRLIRLRLRMAKYSIESLESLPVMVNPEKQAIMDIYAFLFLASIRIDMKAVPLIIFRQVELTLDWGIAPSSGLSFIFYGGVVAGPLGKIDDGYRLSQLGMELVTREHDKKFLHYATHIHNYFTSHLKNPLKSFLSDPSSIIKITLESRNVETQMTIVTMSSFGLMYGDVGLPKIKQFFNRLNKELAADKWHVSSTIIHQFTLNLMGEERGDPVLFAGRHFSASKSAKKIAEGNMDDKILLLFFDVLLRLLFGRYKEGLPKAEKLEQIYLELGVIFASVPAGFFLISLLRLANMATADAKERRRLLKGVLRLQKKMKKWADSAPMNYRHKYLLVEAERCRVLGRLDEALNLYEEAIALVTQNGFLLEGGITLELAGNYYKQRGWDHQAGRSFKEAVHIFEQWGAHAKVEVMKRDYPTYLLEKTHRKDSKKRVSQTTTTGAETAAIFDYNSLVEASAILFSETDLASLLKNLIRLLIKNAGAERAVLALLKEGELFLETAGHSGSDEIGVLCGQPLDTLENGVAIVPAQIMRYVSRSNESVILDDAVTDSRFGNMPYIQTQRPKSILCAPLIHQNRGFGVIYLENNLSIGAFTQERLGFVQLLGSQAAISIANYRAVALREERQRMRLEQEFLKNETVALREAKEVAEQANLAKSRFLAAVSHDLRQP